MIILRSTSLQHFKEEFVNHSGSKCCKKSLKGINCSQAQDEGLKKKKKVVLEKKSRWLKISFYRALLTTTMYKKKQKLN